MTEAEWVACTDPKPMLRFLLGTDHPRVQDVEAFPACRGSDRKLRLFACACYHRISHLLPDALARAAVDIAERFADGMATTEELRQTEARVWGPLEALEGRWRASQGAERAALLPTHEALALALQAVWAFAPKAAYYASSNAYLAIASIANPGSGGSDSGFSASRVAEEKAQTDILRCIFGPLPFRPVTIQPDVLAWNDGLVVRLAQAIYEERRWGDMPLLGDALLDAGCDNDEVLAHCRSGGEHVRGCWAVDLLLGRG
jgi:hypothetical protein